MYECFSSVLLCAGVGSLRGIVLYETQQKDDNITTIMKKKWIGISCNSGFQPTGRATRLDYTKNRTRDIASVLAYNE